MPLQPRELAFVPLALLLIGIAQSVGGPPWALLAAVAVIGQGVTDRRPQCLALPCAALVWLVLARWTGRRDFYFPYTMFLASAVFAQFGDRNFWAGVWGGVAVLSGFFAVRILQQASVRVLVFEFIVATALQEFSMVAHHTAGGRLWSRIAICVTASLLAWLSLGL